MRPKKNTDLLQDTQLNYQKPPEEILNLVDITKTPFVQLDCRGEYALLIHRDQFSGIETLCASEMRLGGLRVNPELNIASREIYYNRLEVMCVDDLTVRQVKGMPDAPRLSNFCWSPDQTKLAFTHSAETGVEAWYIHVENATAHCLTEPCINANLERPLHWMQDGQSLLVKMLPQDRPKLRDAQAVVPQGPTISISDGQKAENRTYQDLLKNRNDAFNFTVLATSMLYRIYLDGRQEKWLPEAALYRNCLVSPDGAFLIVSVVEQPFSYVVPYTRFPHHHKLYTKDGTFVQTINRTPLLENLPKGFMSVREGRRLISWRNDKPATITWVEALDGGDATRSVPHRDAVYTLDARHCSVEPQLLVKTINRFDSLEWSSDELALVHDYWWNTRNTKVYRFQPAHPEQEPRIIIDRNYQDEYSDPGHFLTTRNKYGQVVLETHDDALYLIGEGFSKEGQFPFVDKWSLTTSQKKRLYQSTYTDRLEHLYFPPNIATGEFIVRIEAPTEYPNYYIRNVHKEGDSNLRQITFFDNPFKSIQSVHKEVIQYKREDGVHLSGTLYLPVGYDKERPERVPLIIWAYPREYKDNDSAGQVLVNSNEFIYPHYGSMVYWVTRGYAVLDNAAFPIVGKGEEEPNDTFLKQLIGNAQAAIDAVDALGYIDRARVAVCGHSYGAFMTANLLTHSDLFAAGIARSGAYNRTLTPFGFQSEERNYWEAPEVYQAISPFLHADQMDTPLLLVHGAADSNSGTYPLQSERYFSALKGLGAPTRLVLLPKESHGYVARESIFHLLWEQDQWLERYVKNKTL